ncbi:uncharacterized protein LOC127869579 [Dreissena polymorpha]|uniref:uncharacterized protein LOC127869579 n=1 Tax=Dreissena polymorpha TaxID=45954 RepID=UPI002263C8C9|nr:uncharacterized protein LOC127869579 [Dreissena polymorpha]
MKLKAVKSRALVIKKGQTTERFKLHVQNEEIPLIVKSPIKYLGKWFDASLRDRDSAKKLKHSLVAPAGIAPKTSLATDTVRGCYYDSRSPREDYQKAPQKVARRTAKFHKDWTNKLQLPLSSLVDEFKIAKTRLVLTLRDSPDECIRGAGIETRTSKKWSATESVSQAESNLKHIDIVGVTTVGRQGIGATKTVLWSRSDQQERRAMIQSEVKRKEESARQARAVEMGAQGTWTTWNTTDRKLTWGEIWKYEPLRFSFLLRSVYDLLPSPANLCRWGLTTDPKCSLCDRIGTLEHVLSSCSTALTQGRNLRKRFLFPVSVQTDDSTWGYWQRQKGGAIQRLSQAAERVSSWLWLKREEKSWKHQPTHSD